MSGASPKRRERSRSSIFAAGEPMIWLTGGALVICTAAAVGLVVLVLWKGLTTFWPRPVVLVETRAGSYMGEVTRDEVFRPDQGLAATLGDEDGAELRRSLGDGGGQIRRRLLRTGNFRLTQTHFEWLSDFEITDESRPEWAIVVERLEWGRFYGFPEAFVALGDDGAERRTEGARAAWTAFESLHGGNDSEPGRYRMIFRTAGEGAAAPQTATLGLDEIVRAYPANQLGFLDQAGVYLSRWGEFLSAEPREANSEGGVFPAIFGTVVMTLIMSIAVVPFGVVAALYLREYAKPGPMVSLVRIAVNNLAGVPSIVFGVFGLGFFCYVVGAGIDELLFADRLPNPTYGTGGLLWASLTLALLTLPVVIVATEESLAAVPISMREGSYACGASQWQTIRRIVLPRALPGIITGMILAVSRGAGEVAPLMLVGAVKLAPELPMDGTFPFVHPERSFMHLGFHIYDVGFQSQNSEAAKPMVFTTALLLIAIVAALNVAAITLRGRLQRRFVGGHF